MEGSMSNSKPLVSRFLTFRITSARSGYCLGINIRPDIPHVHQPRTRQACLAPRGNRWRFHLEKARRCSGSAQTINDEIRVHAQILDTSNSQVNSHV